MRSGASVTRKAGASLIQDLQRTDVPLLHLLGMHGGYKGSSNSLKGWADYLFPTLEEALEEARFGEVEEKIFRMMREHDHEDVILEEDTGIYEKRDTLKSFHHQARQSISRKHFWPAFCQFG